MSDKVRQALFNILGPLDGLMVLDAYAGSGAVGFEVLSRGAAQVESIEANRAVARVLEQNRQRLGLDWGHTLVVSTVESWLARPARTNYDLIIATPPYAAVDPDIAHRLGQRLKAGGLLVWEQASRTPTFELKSLRLRQSRVYGDTTLNFYQGA